MSLIIHRYAFGVTGSLAFTFLTCTLAAAVPPNVVIILADDLGFADVSFTHPLFIANPSDYPVEVKTPNIDALANQGIIFANGYVTGNVCSPSRAGLMTGRYQQRLGLYTAGEAGAGMVPLSATSNNGPFTTINPLIPVWLKQPLDGAPAYVSGSFGKWHLGLDAVYTNFLNLKTVETSYTNGGANGYGTPTNGPTASSSPGKGSPWHPLNRGFDVSFNFMDRGAHDYWGLNDLYYGYTRTGGLSSRTDPGGQLGADDPVASWDAGYKINTERIPANYLPNKTTDEACAFINSQVQAGKRFFCYLPFNAAHDPSQAPFHFDADGNVEVLSKTDGKRYDITNPDWFPDPIWFYKQYPTMEIPSYNKPPATEAEADTIRRTRAVTLAMVYWIDRNVGRVVKTLKDAGVYDDTLIVFLSDNGGASGMQASNLPLHGHKSEHYEGGVHIPFAFSWPALLNSLPAGSQGGRVITTPVSSLDILPTLLDAAGLPPLVAPAGLDYTLDGSSMLPLIKGTTNKIHDNLFWSEGTNGAGISRMGKWKLIINQANYLLYDLDADVAETTDLAAANPEIVRQLRQNYYEWLVDVAADAKEAPQIWTVNSTPGGSGYANLTIDPFTYAVAPLGIQAGGSGWAGNWASTNTQVLNGALTFPSANYTNGTDSTHVAGLMQANAKATAIRPLASLGGTVWMSFLTQYVGPNTIGASTGPNNNHETAIIINGDITDQVRIYGGSNNANAGLYDAGVKLADVNPDTAIPTDATTVLHILKFETNVSDEGDRLTWYWTTNPANLTSQTTATLANMNSITKLSVGDWWGDSLTSIGMYWKSNSTTATSGSLNDRAFDNLRISYGLTDDKMIEAILLGTTDTVVPASSAINLKQFDAHNDAVTGENRFTMEYDLKRSWLSSVTYEFSETLLDGSWKAVTPAVVRQLDAFGDADTFSVEFPITTTKAFYRIKGQ